MGGLAYFALDVTVSAYGKKHTTKLEKYDWTRLNHLQLGRYAEYFAKMEFTLFGFEVYTSEVDDRGIDFVIKRNGKYYDIQVKSARGNNYIFFQKDKFDLRPNLFATVLLFRPGNQPNIYLIPSIDWTNPNGILMSRDYEGKKSKPEWGSQISKKNYDLLENYTF